MRIRLMTVTLALASLPAPAAVAQTGSRGIPYTGHLELDGEPLDGPTAITFYLYDALTGGTMVWSESHPTVTVAQGSFQVMLGLDQAVGSILRPYGDLFVEISVNGQRLTGRQPLGSVPFAYRGAPGSDFVVDGELEFGRGCTGGDPTTCAPRRCTGAATVEVAGGSAPGFNSASIRFNRQFGGAPTVVVTPACGSLPCNFAADGPFLTSVDSTGFVLGWNDPATTSALRRFHWVAIGPCP